MNTEQNTLNWGNSQKKAIRNSPAELAGVRSLISQEANSMINK